MVEIYYLLFYLKAFFNFNFKRLITSFEGFFQNFFTRKKKKKKKYAFLVILNVGVIIIWSLFEFTSETFFFSSRITFFILSENINFY